MNYTAIAKILITVGGIMLVCGALLLLFGKYLPSRLPGDIFIQKGNFSFFFPVVSCLVISLILTLIFNLFNR